jgi:hypothetical protein
MGDPSGEWTRIHIELPNHWGFKGESMWVRNLGDDLYEIRNIPCCAYGLNYCDVARARADAVELKPEIREVVRWSGHRTLRASFADSRMPEDRQDKYIRATEAIGALVERATPTFICIDIPPEASYAQVREYLEQLEAAGALSYETCEERIPGSFDDAPAAEATEDGA